MPELVRAAVAGRVAVVTLNRPERRNAITQDLLDQLNSALAAAEADPAVAAVLLRGAGNHFSVGDDLDEFANGGVAREDAERLATSFQQVTRHLMFGTKPTVCAVQGWAVGGALSWVVNCDFSLWAEDARAVLPEAGHGLVTTGGLSVLLPAAVGPTRAREMMLLSEPMPAASLLAWGLAHQVVTLGDLGASAMKVANRLASLPPGSAKGFRSLLIAPGRAALEAALELEAGACIAAVLDAATAERLANWRARKATSGAAASQEMSA